MSIRHAVFIATCCFGALGAADVTPPVVGGDAAVKPPAVPQRMSPQTMIRPPQSFEVEMITIAPGDRAGLATWVELAAQGYHVIGTVAQDGKQVLLLERMAQGAKELRLPTDIQKDQAAATAVGAKIQAILAERQAAEQQAQQAQAQAQQVQAQAMAEFKARMEAQKAQSAPQAPAGK